ncbi:hypothetical protein UPYG_G00247540 [Umbra pygmaea]|uniref:Zinc finger CCCH domain-containing protein 14 n=1 Tax=Umbra pygmaea TaxID=75934 RepID=A0ABD0W7B5_UMBPY
MEIGTEISKKIRAAIKGKLQELGAYVDEELPDYIMVMVANKKTSQQMSDDLSLFLGNNTIKFTVWLHGVLEKLRSVAVEPASPRPQLYSSSAPGTLHRKGEESKGLSVTSSRSDRIEARVSSSAHDHRRGSSDQPSRLTSSVKPLMDAPSSEAVIDIKPELDDEFTGEDPVDVGVRPGRLRGPTSGGGARASALIYRPPQGRTSSGIGRPADAHRSSEGSSGSQTRQQQGSYQLESRSSREGRSYRDGGGSKQEDASRKRKAPVASSVVRLNQDADTDPDSDELDDEDDEEEEGYGVKGMSSRVSLPSKPERKPTLPPAKQANKNLLMRAMSEAQVSVNKTTTYQPIPQRQTVPVAPRTRYASDEMNAAIQLVQEHLHGLAPRGQTYTPSEPQAPRQLAPHRSLTSRLQLDVPEERMRSLQTDYLALEVVEGSSLNPLDTRSFIMRRPELGEEGSSVRRLGQLEPQVPAKSRLTLEENVPVRNRLTLEENVPVRNRLTLEENVPVRNRLTLEENVPVRNRLTLEENVPVRNRLTLEENVPVRNRLTLEENVPIRNRLTLEENVPIRNRLTLEENVPIRNRLTLEENVPIRNRLGLEEVAPLRSSRPEETSLPIRSRLGALLKEEDQPALPRMVQQASRENLDAVRSASPKFIVTLDGVPSPLGNLGDCDMEAEDRCPKATKPTMTDPSIHPRTRPKTSIHHRLQGEQLYSDEEMEAGPEEAGSEVIPVKRQKVQERCKFWPVCKSGDDCLYHHPTTQCKTFPSCKFGDKCLFVHPNCKFDSKCSKQDCPFTHVSRRGPAPYSPPARPAPPPQTSAVCRFFPECKKMDCPFYHPKPCRFAAKCKRPGCSFYHPAVTVPPRHALKWTKMPSS